MQKSTLKSALILGIGLAVFCAWGLRNVFAQLDDVEALPGGSLDPTTIEKYKIPLVIPPVMNQSHKDYKKYGKKYRKKDDDYDIAVRQFQQQILPGGIWYDLGLTTQDLPATTVWSYGPAADPTPAVAPDPNSQFNYPAYTIETKSDKRVNVRWINDLVDEDGNFLKHLLPIDQTLHWANPPAEGCRDGSSRTDCATDNPDFYEGPVPIVTHVHGAHVDPHSDGYPEAWWLPKAKNIPDGYATHGTLFDDATGKNSGKKGYADYSYRQDQPATTLWYHDHSLGMTRSNVYAGPAGFWLIRGGKYDKTDNVTTKKKWDGVLPGPAPRAGDTVLELNAPGVMGAKDIRRKIREIPIVIQGRSFNDDGSLFYTDNRAFFEGLNSIYVDTPQFPGAGVLDTPFIPESDIAPIWNPEAFFNVMVVNGVSWPFLEVAPALYRFRFLNGCNSRFLWLKFDNPDVEVWQIGAEQGFLPAPVLMNDLNLDQSGDNTAQLLMGLAERADVIVDFRDLPNGTEIYLINIGPDEPFGGGVPGVDFTPADLDTTGQVMLFKVNDSLLNKKDYKTTDPANLKLIAERPLGKVDNTRQVSLNEEISEEVCVVDDGNGGLIALNQAADFDFENETCTGFDPLGRFDGRIEGEIFGPKAALLGTVTGTGATASGNPLKWTDASDPNNIEAIVRLQSGAKVKVNVTENPTLGDTEMWEMYNFTADAHPIHLHLVRFEVVDREIFSSDSPNFIPSDSGGNIGATFSPESWETGFKDTVISYPGEITRIKAKFDIEGLYVWHCHIVEHEDNEMMRPYVVSKKQKKHDGKWKWWKSNK